jgi:hypothetical protein
MFWDMTPKQYQGYHKQYVKKETEKVRENDLLNHILGQYIMIGVNEPKKYPNKPQLTENNEPVDMTDEEMETRARRNTIRMGGIVK